MLSYLKRPYANIYAPPYFDPGMEGIAALLIIPQQFTANPEDINTATF